MTNSLPRSHSTTELHGQSYRRQESNLHAHYGHLVLNQGRLPFRHSGMVYLGPWTQN